MYSIQNNFFYQSFIDGHLNGFQFFAIINIQFFVIINSVSKYPYQHVYTLVQFLPKNKSLESNCYVNGYVPFNQFNHKSL